MSGGIRRYNRPERDFMMVHRSFARMSTKDLPMRGRTVGLYVLSHDHGYVQTQKDIARRLDMAVRTVADALTDLERAGLLVRVPERNARGHRTGTAMHVSDVPFTDQEVADLLGSLPAKSADAESADAESAGHKESNSKQESKREEDQPSGGAAAAAPALESTSLLEETMPRTAAPADVPALFDVEPESRPVREKTPGPNDVVAAYVTSFREAHGAEPLKQDKSRVGRDARAFLRDEQATLEELVVCAQVMGRTTYANLGQQLKFKRHAAPSKTKFHPAAEYVPDEWADLKSLSDQAVADISSSIWDEVPA